MIRSTNPSTAGFSTAGAMRRALFALPAIALCAGAAQASSVTFDYNSASLYDTTQDTTNNSAQVQSYMNTALTSAGIASTVTVTGAASSGNASGSPGYNADGHVVCTGNSCSTGTPDTLSTEYHTPYILNASGSSAINMTFTGAVQVSSLSFHFEIFPDGTTQQPPDFVFTMNGGATENCAVLGLAPGSALTTTAPACTTGAISSFSGGPSDSAANKHSPMMTTETNAQYLGTMTFNFASPVTLSSLNFADWPAEIGITDLVITTPPPPVPEPGTLAILASGLVGLGIVRRHRKARAA